jgi:hypothetical protein
MRLVLALLLLIPAVLDQTCLAGEAGGAKNRGAPDLYFHADTADPAYGSVDLENLSTETIAQLRRDNPSAARWQSLFSVLAEQEDQPENGTLPAVLGQYELLQDRVRFTPHFRPVPGLKYRVNADLSTLPGSITSTSLSILFSLPQESPVTSTAVDNIFPSGGELPENLLRFYVYFSAPMQRGMAPDQIFLLGPDGTPVTDAFFNSPTELWDPSMRRLTLLLDPGRIKRGVGPNVVLGLPLRRGYRYTLVIGAGMTGAAGRPLRKSFLKSFVVVTGVRDRIDPGQWAVEVPGSGTRRPLALMFPAPLDQALLSRSIHIVDADRNAVPGHVEIDRHEMRWAFTPASAWAAGPYRILIEPSLEDVSGNTTWAAFDAEPRVETPWQSAERRLSLAFWPCAGRIERSAGSYQNPCNSADAPTDRPQGEQSRK